MLLRTLSITALRSIDYKFYRIEIKVFDCITSSKGVEILKQNNITMLMPEYMKDFKCIGSACEDTCCRGWQIEIDETTYHLYRNINDEELKPIFAKYLHRKNDSKNVSDYGRISLNDNGKCPFLDERALCMIQKKVGENSLSKTCWTFPRIYNIIDDEAEKCAALSCPEAARAALLNAEGMRFEKLQVGYSSKDGVVNFIKTTQDSVSSIKKYFWDLRIFGLNILQNRNYSIDIRMYLLGLFTQNVIYMQENRNTHEIPAFLSTFEEMVSNNEFEEVLNGVTFDFSKQVYILRAIMNLKKSRGISGNRYLTVFNETVSGLGLDNNLKINNIQAVENYKNFVTNHEYIYENYLVNEFFKNILPIGMVGDVWESFTIFSIMYGVIKLHLMGVCISRNHIDCDTAVEVIQSVTKEFGHNNDLSRVIYNILKESHMVEVSHLAMFIRNPEGSFL